MNAIVKKAAALVKANIGKIIYTVVVFCLGAAATTL